METTLRCLSTGQGQQWVLATRVLVYLVIVAEAVTA